MTRRSLVIAGLALLLAAYLFSHLANGRTLIWGGAVPKEISRLVARVT